MALFPDDSELDELHQRWTEAQQRKIAAEDANRTASLEAVQTAQPGQPLDLKPIPLEHLERLDKEAHDAAAAFEQLDAEYQPRAQRYREEPGRH